MKLMIMSLIASLFSFLSCNAQNDKFKSVGVDEFALAIADSSVVLLDVRTPKEYAEGHIDGAININVMESSFATNVSSLPINKTIAVYCRSGRRSKNAANILADKGYTVIELSSGYMGWLKAVK